MEKHLELTDEEFIKEFSACTLEPSVFSHQAHLRLTWIILNQFEIDAAIDEVKQLIKKYVQHLGAEDKYNETVTIAGVRAVYHFMLKSACVDFSSFIKTHPSLQNNFKGLLLSHYKTNIFESESARIAYLKPELLPFD